MLRIARPDQAYFWATHAGADLELDSLFVVYPGDRRYALAERVQVVPLSALLWN